MIDTAKRSFARARSRFGLLDHLVRAYGRFQADHGNQLAAAVTFYWFLSLFPILLLAISILGFAYGDAAPQKVSGALSGFLPEQLVDTIGDTLVDAKGRAGVIGLSGLLLAGLGWIDGLREALRAVWHRSTDLGNPIVRKALDVVALAGLLATIVASVLLTGATTAASDGVLSLLGVESTTAAQLGTQALAYLLSGAADTALFLYLFTRLPGGGVRVREVWRGAVFGAIGFGLLKFAGAFYVARTTTSGEATYGTFAVVVGLLLFLNLISRLILLAAAFAVTAPGDSDVPPSETADAPKPDVVPQPVAEVAVPAGPTPAQQATVQTAARITAAALGAGLVVVGVGAARTIRGVLQR